MRFGRTRNDYLLWTIESGEKLVLHLREAPVCCYGNLAHAPESMVVTRNRPPLENVVGRIGAVWLEGDGVHSKLFIYKEAMWMGRLLLDLDRRGALETLGLSIHISMTTQPFVSQGGPSKGIAAITKLFSVDIVGESLAGGKFIRPYPSSHIQPRREATWKK